jgi:hypothetical protein
MEVTTFRWNAHVGVDTDWGKGRPSEGLDRWPSDDPLVRLVGAHNHDLVDRVGAELAVHKDVDEAFLSAIADFERINAVAGLEAPPAPGARV